MTAPAETTARPQTTARRVAPGTRTFLLVFAVLTLVATNQLFVLAAATSRWFAWTIQPPLTAAFLGAGYASGFLLVVLVLRTRLWVEARLTLVSVLVFASLSLVATLLHTDRFHFTAPGERWARTITTARPTGTTT
jgi:hypothetical protein